MVMDSFNKKKLLPILFCFLFLSTFIATSVNAVDQQTSIFLSDPGDIYSTRFSSTNVVDSEGQLHVFVKKDFKNNTFVIFHSYNNQMVEIFRNIFSGYIFKAYTMDENVVLLFSFSDGFYNTVIEMFSWSENGSNFKQVFTSRSAYINVDIIPGNNYFYLLSRELETTGTSITQTKVYLNGTIVEKIFVLPFTSVYLVSLHMLDEELFAFYDVFYYNESSYTAVRTLIIAGITGNLSYYNSTVFVMEGNYDRVQLFIGEDGKFHLAMLEFQLLYSVSFSVNDTISKKSFLSINLGVYTYEKFRMISYQNTSFFLFVTTLYVEIFSPSGYNRYTQSNKISIVEDDNQTISLFSFMIEDVMSYYSYMDEGSNDRVSITLFENRTYSPLLPEECL